VGFPPAGPAREPLCRSCRVSAFISPPARQRTDSGAPHCYDGLVMENPMNNFHAPKAGVRSPGISLRIGHAHGRSAWR
jgi:hypothetical protein